MIYNTNESALTTVQKLPVLAHKIFAAKENKEMVLKY